MGRIRLLNPPTVSQDFPEVFIDPEYFLVLGKRPHTSPLAQIAGSLTELRQLITVARRAGKYVLVLPGSYDLAHIGHIVYVEQCIQAFVEFCKCTRDKAFVVLLTDDDEMIRHAKRDKVSTEPFPRPVETLQDRLNTLSAFPVDLVGFLPFSDSGVAGVREALLLPLIFGEDSKNLFLSIFEEVSGLLPRFRSTQTSADLEKALNNRNDLESWYYRIHSYLFYCDDGEDRQLPVVTRFVSTHDKKYILPVLWMNLNIGVEAHLIEDVLIYSTSEMVSKAVAEHGEQAWDFLRAHKAAQKAARGI